MGLNHLNLTVADVPKSRRPKALALCYFAAAPSSACARAMISPSAQPGAI